MSPDIRRAPLIYLATSAAVVGIITFTHITARIMRAANGERLFGISDETLERAMNDTSYWEPLHE